MANPSAENEMRYPSDLPGPVPGDRGRYKPGQPQKHCCSYGLHYPGNEQEINFRGTPAEDRAKTKYTKTHYEKITKAVPVA